MVAVDAARNAEHDSKTKKSNVTSGQIIIRKQDQVSNTFALILIIVIERENAGLGLGFLFQKED